MVCARQSGYRNGNGRKVSSADPKHSEGLYGARSSPEAARGPVRPHVAVVIPCHNAGPWISRAVENALAQSHRPLTVVAVDDGSSDDTLARLQDFGDAILVESGPNRGACHARNRGFETAVAAGASHVVFLDADDYFEGQLVTGMAETAGRTGADLVLGNMHLEYPGSDGRPPRRERRFLYSGRVRPEEFLTGWMTGAYVNPSALLWKAEIVGAIGGWDEDLWRAQDLDFVLRAMFESPRIEKSETGAAIYCRQNANSISRQLSERAQRSRFQVSARLLDRVLAPGMEQFAAAAPCFLGELYLVRVECLRDGHTALAAEIARLLEAHGWRGHVGTPAHRLAATLLGLERKVALAGALRRLARFMRRRA